MKLDQYANLALKNADKLGYRDLLNKTINMVAKKYPALSHDDAQYVAELMARHDEDVIKINDEYLIASEVHNSL